MTSGRLGDVDPRSLAATRVELHHAAVIVSAFGRSLAPREPGFRHAALTWAEAARGLQGAPVPTVDTPAIRAALAFDPPRLVIRAAGAPARGDVSLALPGTTAAGALEFLRGAVTAVDLDPGRIAIRTPSDLADGPLRNYGPFDPDPSAAAELARWFGFADGLLTDVATANELALPVPCWPDHFDLAVVARPAGSGLASDAQITLGFSPGDHTIAEPYLYVVPWPLAATSVGEIPAPAGGHWQVEGWVGLAITASALLRTSEPKSDASTFLERGFEIARDLLRAG